ncbi:serine protease grass-like [Anopheles cruzii]|uniref:serine protease grass-like n=1 Tax=Anopheles cruzii TaxID=68878 RepID=UPI0022EC6F37|nr:serine protease grass-like [Anopheles cruzii]
MNFSRQVVLLATVALICSSGTCGAEATCANPNERCLPIEYCSPTLASPNRIHDTLDWTKKLCKPVVAITDGDHVCCPKPKIECNLNGEPGACVRKARCKALRSEKESRLLKSYEKYLCYTYNGQNYFCCTDPHCQMRKKKCDGDDVVVRPPKTPRIGSESVYPPCAKGKKLGAQVPTALCTGGQSKNDTMCCVPPKVHPFIVNPKAAKLANMSCGVPGMIPKIANGTAVFRGEFPWMVSLLYRPRASSLCSGTLIHPRYVLTAKHCVRGRAPHTVRLGTLRLSGSRSGEQDPDEQVIAVNARYPHEWADIALLRLSKEATLVEGLVQPICLPLYAKLLMHLPRNVIIAGWGLTENEEVSENLLKADTEVVLKGDDCDKDYEVCTRRNSGTIHCPGDSGGPYQGLSDFNGVGRFVQYAVISRGSSSCREPEHSGKGVMIGYFIDWILQHIPV